ncbi:MAG: o-succinylbenzoate synthase [Planctomycetaceae bacterium]|nr:o-succinylbenzoate synthase [Planctomycetaceae bacterium]
MHIDSIDLYCLGLPYRSPRSTAVGPLPRLETVLVAMHGDGATGWGEACPGVAPQKGPEWTAGVFSLLRDWLAPAVVDRTVSSGDELTALLGSFHGNRWAKSAIDAAWWDLEARRQNRPLHQLLGGRRDAIEVGPTFDRMDSIDEFLEQLDAAVAEGFDRIKLKFRPGWDLQVVDLARKQCPTQSLHVDCEGGLHLGHQDMLFRLEDFMLSSIEQPLPADDLVGHAMVQESLRTPIVLDESITTLAQAEMALELDSCRGVNLKPGRVGGLTAASAICELCHERCTPCYVGGEPQSAIGNRIAMALASKDGCCWPADFFPSDRELVEDVAEPPLPIRDPSDGRPRIRLSSAPGIGVEPDPKRLDEFCLTRTTVRPV